MCRKPTANAGGGGAFGGGGIEEQADQRPGRAGEQQRHGGHERQAQARRRPGRPALLRGQSAAPTARPIRIVAAWLRPRGTMKAMLASCSAT